MDDTNIGLSIKPVFNSSTILPSRIVLLSMINDFLFKNLNNNKRNENIKDKIKSVINGSIKRPRIIPIKQPTNVHKYELKILLKSKPIT